MGSSFKHTLLSRAAPAATSIVAMLWANAALASQGPGGGPRNRKPSHPGGDGCPGLWRIGHGRRRRIDRRRARTLSAGTYFWRQPVYAKLTPGKSCACLKVGRAAGFTGASRPSHFSIGRTPLTRRRACIRPIPARLCTALRNIVAGESFVRSGVQPLCERRRRCIFPRDDFRLEVHVRRLRRATRGALLLSTVRTGCCRQAPPG